MRKLQLRIRPSGYRRWSVELGWYPSQTANYGWQWTSRRITGMGLTGKGDVTLPARLLCARLAYVVRQAGRDGDLSGR